MTEKKYILFIVEGDSDYMFYGEYFNDLVSENNFNLDIKVTDGDILTKKVNNPIQLVKNSFNYALQKSKLKKTDFVQIFQICDIDGSYFSEEQFIINSQKEYYDKSYQYSPYGSPNINVPDQKSKESIIATWSTKKHNQDILSTTESIDMGNEVIIPYKLFYVSLFLEHLLKNDPLIDPCDKRDCIDDYIDYHKLENFIDLLDSKKNSDEFDESWEILKTNGGIYNPSSNLNILVNILKNNLLSN